MTKKKVLNLDDYDYVRASLLTGKVISSKEERRNENAFIAQGIKRKVAIDVLQHKTTGELVDTYTLKKFELQKTLASWRKTLKIK